MIALIFIIIFFIYRKMNDSEKIFSDSSFDQQETLDISSFIVSNDVTNSELVLDSPNDPEDYDNYSYEEANELLV